MQKEINHTKKYTFILEFRGGTYIKQVSKKSIKKAFNKWISILTSESYKKYFSTKEQKFFKENSINLEQIVPLEGIENVWYNGFLYKNEYYHFHIILTNNGNVSD